MQLPQRNQNQKTGRCLSDWRVALLESVRVDPAGVKTAGSKEYITNMHRKIVGKVHCGALLIVPELISRPFLL